MNISKAYEAYGAARTVDSAAKTSRKQAPEKTAAPVPKEQVELSDESQTFQMVKDAVDKAPEVRIPLVQEISQKIKFNGYPFETKIYKMVEKMIDTKIV